ncbi:MAG TPA: OmpA family protein, partial [Flavisolibacter sp.]|nr:OmpA family protein [Flavisolibacter sp.]
DFLYQKEKLRNTSPQILLQEADSLAPSKTWQKVSLTYTATGEENFISIGDFKRGAHSIAGTPDLGRDYYFFIDDVSLKPLNPSEKLCPGWTRLKEDEYDFNVRHSQLDKLIYVYTRRPPLVEAAPKTVVQRIDTLVIPDVLFATNSYTLEAGAKDVLDEFVSKVKSVQVDSVVVEGHTDSHGSMALNQQLSQNRAASVASYIQPHFQTATLTKAFASQKPVADNRTSAGRQKNRRVEIYIYVRE